MLNFNFKFGFTIIGFCPGIEHWKSKVDKLKVEALSKRQKKANYYCFNSEIQFSIFQGVAFVQELKLAIWKLKIENRGNEQTTKDSQLLLFQFSNSIVNVQVSACVQELNIENLTLNIEKWGDEQTTKER